MGQHAAPDVAAQVIPYTEDPWRECTEEDPCAVAYWANVVLNSNDPSMANPVVRHRVLTHEFGHVAGQGHTMLNCTTFPASIMAPGWCLDWYGLHWVRPSDVVFTNVKYP